MASNFISGQKRIHTAWAKGGEREKEAEKEKTKRNQKKEKNTGHKQRL